MVEVLNGMCRLHITGVVLACHISIIYSISVCCMLKEALLEDCRLSAVVCCQEY